jgi:hypothetical protein
MANAWLLLQRLVRSDPEQVGVVVTHHSDGTSTVELIGGGLLRVQGQDVAEGANAYIRGGRIIGEAPDLEGFEIEI